MSIKTFDRANPATKQMDVYSDFSGGVNTELENDFVQDNEFRKLINFDMDKAGALVKRPGLYRLPYIRDLLKAKWSQVVADKIIYNGVDEQGQKIPADLADKEILDCVTFFDGSHWVYNYITNKGIMVLLLTTQMTLPDPADLTDQQYLTFYPYGDEIKNEAGGVEKSTLGDLSLPVIYNAKITKFQDTYMLIVSYYYKPTLDPKTQGLKQVKLYTWNPIKRIVENKEEPPRWVEAAEHGEKVIEDTAFQGTEYINLSSLPLRDFIDKLQAGNETFKLESIEASPWMQGLGTEETLEITHKENSKGAYIEINRGNGKVSTVQLIHQNGVFIKEDEIMYYTIVDKNTVGVYLYDPVKGNAEWLDNPWTEQVRWLYVDINEERCIHNRWLVQKGTSKLEEAKFVARGVYFKSPVKVCSAPGGKTRASKIIFQEDGVPVYIDMSWNRDNSAIFASGPTTVVPNIRNNYDINTKAWFRDNIPLNHKGTASGIGNVVSSNSVFYEYVGFGSVMGSGMPDSWSDQAKDEVKVTGGVPLPPKAPSIANAESAWQKEGNTTYTSWGRLPNKGVDARVIWISSRNDWLNSSDKSIVNTNRRDFAFTPMVDVKAQGWDNAGDAAYHDFGSGKKLWRERYTVGRPPQTRYRMTYYNWSPSYMHSIRPEAKVEWQNKLLDTEKFGLGSTGYYVTYSLKGQQYRQHVTSGIINQDTLTFRHVTPLNVQEVLADNGVITDTDIYFTGKEIFGDLIVEQFEEVIRQSQTGIVANPQLIVQFQKAGITDYLTAAIKPYNLYEFIEAMVDDEPRIICRTLFWNNKLYYLNFYWVDSSGQENPLVSLSPTTIPNFDNYSTEILNTAKLNFIANYLPNGYVSQVLNFKQTSYLKPNLNDLSYIWYNMLLYSNLNPSAYPDIYDPTTHPNISWALTEYPTGEGTTDEIQLFGIQPVNNVTLQPGKQRFQIFYKGPGTKEAYDNYLIAVTAMTVNDYNAMINSADFSTDGIPKDKDDTRALKSPPWKPWKDVLKYFDDDKDFIGWDDEYDPADEEKKYGNPNFEVKGDAKQYWGKRAVFELTIPSTTSAYMVLVQTARKNPEYQDDETEAESRAEDDTTKKVSKIILSSVSETRIQMQPAASGQTKLNIVGLYDEFTSLSNLSSFASSVIGYGQSNKLFFSDVGKLNNFPLSRIISLPTPESIQSCTEFQAKLVVSTENSKYYIGGSSFESEQDPFYLKNISTDSGILAPKSDTPLGDYLYFLDKDGIKILKNLYGTPDKEFSFSYMDTKIKSMVPKTNDARNAVGVSYMGKYYLCFPSYDMILVYNPDYKAWVSYEGPAAREDSGNATPLFNFIRMFVNDGELYGVDKNDGTIFRFDPEVYVDDWNPFEDGYRKEIAEDGSIYWVQAGKRIDCLLQTKNLDQAYKPHRKKYDWALLNVTIKGAEVPAEYLVTDGISDTARQAAVNSGAAGYVTPYIFVDDNLINYTFDTYADLKSSTEPGYYKFRDTNNLTPWIRDDTFVGNTTIIDYSRLAKNDNSYYNIPIQRTGNTVALGIEYNGYSGFVLNSFTVRYSLRRPRMNRRGIS